MALGQMRNSNNSLSRLGHTFHSIRRQLYNHVMCTVVVCVYFVMHISLCMCIFRRSDHVYTEYVGVCMKAPLFAYELYLSTMNYRHPPMSLSSLGSEKGSKNESDKRIQIIQRGVAARVLVTRTRVVLCQSERLVIIWLMVFVLVCSQYVLSLSVVSEVTYTLSLTNTIGKKHLVSPGIVRDMPFQNTWVVWGQLAPMVYIYKYLEILIPHFPL